MSKVIIKGIMPAMITPLKPDNTIDETALRNHIEWLLPFGISGLYVAGSTGEGILLSPQERKRLMRLVVEIVAGRGLVVCHIADMRLENTLELARYARTVGVDMISAIPPIFFKYDQSEIVDYYESIAKTADLPLLMYSIDNSGNSIDLEVVKRLISNENIVGIKWTHYNYYMMERLKSINGGDINIVNGPDESIICGLAAGADAGIGSTYNTMPGLFVDLYRSFCEGDVEAARFNQKIINDIISVYIKYGVFRSIRTILRHIGTDVGDSPAPARAFSEDEKREFLSELDWFDFKTQKQLR